MGRGWMGVLGDMEGGQIYWTEKGKKMHAYFALLESCIEYTIVNIPPTPSSPFHHPHPFSNTVTPHSQATLARATVLKENSSTF